MKIKDLMLKIESNKRKIQELNEETSNLSKELINKLQNKKLKNYILEDEESLLNATVVERNALSFNLDMLKKKLGKANFNEITESNVEVDKAELRELFSSNPRLKKELKSALIITKVLNENKLKKLIDKGEISKEEIEGTYEVKTSNYLRLERKSYEE